MPQIRLDLTGVQNLDLTKGKRVQLPRRHTPVIGEQTLIRGALTTYAATGRPNAGLIKDFLALPSGSLGVTIVGTISGVIMPAGFDLTVALGSFVAASLYGANISEGGGFYFWWSPKEFGVYGGFVFGAAAQIASVGAGTQLTILFGPAPTTLGGFNLVVGVDFTVAGLPIVVGGFLVFSIAPFRFVGFGYDLGGGFGAFPIEFHAGISGTLTKRIGRI
jgi:hypothetical protein